MFTGIIQAVGKIESLEHGPEGGRLRVHIADAPQIAAGLQMGSSIAVNGCCLTVVELSVGAFAADLSGETLRKTSFGELKPSHTVNLERPLTAGAEFGGHFVQGHVDGVGRVMRLVAEGNNAEPKAWWLSVRVPEALERYIAEKGSLAIDGISLTVARWQDGIADIAVIPFTYSHTNVANMTVGDAVNLECDILAKYVERLIEARGATAGSRITISKLIDEGF
jgi:riboflavin synthase